MVERDPKDVDLAVNDFESGSSEVLEPTQELSIPSNMQKRCELRVLDGVSAGFSKLYTFHPITVGRLESCDLTILSRAVSRLHFTLDFTRSKSWELYPENRLVLVNGTKIEGPTALSHGDLITFGENTIRFLLHPGEPTAVEKHSLSNLVQKDEEKDPKWIKEQFWKQHKRKLIWLSSVGGVILLAGLAIVLGEALGAGRGEKAASVQAVLDEANKLYLKGDLDASQARLRWVLLKDSSNEAALQLNSTLEREFLAKKNYESALSDYQANRFASAESKLEKIPETSIYYGEAQALAYNVENAYVLSVENETKKLEKASEYKQALSKLQTFMETHPGHQQLELLKQKLLSEEALYRDLKNKILPLLDKQRFQTVFGVLNQYESKKLNFTEQYRNKLKIFVSDLTLGRNALVEREVIQAVELLHKAYTKVDEIAFGNKNQLVPYVTNLYVSALYLEAFVDNEDGKICEAADTLWHALTLSPQDPKIISATDLLMKQASDAYKRASELQNTQKASDIAQKALCLVPETAPIAKALVSLIQ